ncbi:LysR family transcriptional regulator [Streptomyces cacaoi]
MVHRAELATLRTFLSIYRSGGVAKAAYGLGLSQPAVSLHLKNMEHLVGRPLFERSGRGIAPTEVGHVLAAQVRAHLDALEGVLGAYQATAEEHAAPLFLGAPSDLLWPHILQRLTPLVTEGLHVHCRIGLSPHLTEALLDGQLDLAVLTKIEHAPTRQLHLRHLCEEEFVLIGGVGERPYSHHDAGRRFIGYSGAMPMARRYFRQCWGAPPPTPVLTVADVRTLAAAAEAGTGLSVVPRYLVQSALDAGQLAILHTPQAPVVNSVHLAARIGREHLPRVRAVFDVVCPAA